MNPQYISSVYSLMDGYFTHFSPERTHDLDMPEEEEESAKLQSKKGAADVTRGSNILNKVVTRYHYYQIITTIIIIIIIFIYKGGLQQGARPQVPVHRPGCPRLRGLHRPRGRAGEGVFFSNLFILKIKMIILIK